MCPIEWDSWILRNFALWDEEKLDGHFFRGKTYVPTFISSIKFNYMVALTKVITWLNLIVFSKVNTIFHVLVHIIMQVNSIEKSKVQHPRNKSNFVRLLEY